MRTFYIPATSPTQVFIPAAASDRVFVPIKLPKKSSWIITLQSKVPLTVKFFTLVTPNVLLTNKLLNTVVAAVPLIL
jgi:hypothetical protein